MPLPEWLEEQLKRQEEERKKTMLRYYEPIRPEAPSRIPWHSSNPAGNPDRESALERTDRMMRGELPESERKRIYTLSQAEYLEILGKLSRTHRLSEDEYYNLLGYMNGDETGASLTYDELAFAAINLGKEEDASELRSLARQQNQHAGILGRLIAIGGYRFR